MNFGIFLDFDRLFFVRYGIWRAFNETRVNFSTGINDDFFCFCEIMQIRKNVVERKLPVANHPIYDLSCQSGPGDQIFFKICIQFS